MISFPEYPRSVRISLVLQQHLDSKEWGPNLCSTQSKYKLGLYPQQPQRFMFTNLSEACCEAKRWNLLQNPVEPDLAAPKPPGTFSATFSGTFSGTC